MSLTLRQSQHRRRRERRIRILKRLGVLAGLGALGWLAYASGSELAEREVTRLQDEVATLTQRIADLDEQTAQLETEVHEARLQEQQWRQRYEREVPSGPSRDLASLVQQRLSEGVRPARLALVIGAAANEPVCEGEPDTKRFIVRTPNYRGPNASVGFARNAITVTAEGQSGTDADGNHHAWFDAAESVTVSFAQLGGKTSEVSGVLPLHHSVIVDDAEYRFSIVAGESRGFVNVTSERCQSPLPAP